MGADAPIADYYAILQVHPDAEQEVIDAAFRQLMKKYHPDVAGDDPRLAMLHHHRATVINRAYSVLRDPVQRRMYDRSRIVVGTRPPAPPPEWPARGPSVAPPTMPVDTIEEIELEPPPGHWIRAPFAALAAAYYLLPGPYEWEADRKQELLTMCLLPVLGIAAFALVTGRLGPLIGHSVGSTLLAWAILLLLSLPVWRSLPRAALAGAPSALLLAGALDQPLRQAQLPAWLAWVALGFLSLILSARLYLFSVLPTLGACWLLTRLG